MFVAEDVEISSRSAGPLPTECQPVAFSGMATYAGRLYQGKITDNLSPSALITAAGKFTCVMRDGQRFILTTDFFGLQTIFYFTGTIGGRKIFAASNRFEIFVYHLKKMGATLSINLPHAANSLYSEQGFFQQSYSHQTSCSEICILPVDVYLSISEGTASLVRKELYQRSFSGSGTYQTALLAGVTEALDGIKTIMRDPTIKYVKQSLSGGHDSRLVLGFCIKAESADRLSIYTEDPPSNPADLRISAGLVRKFNLSWDIGDDRPQVPITDRQALRIWRHYQGNLYHRIGYNSHVSAGLNRGSIELSGGGGEVYRKFWSPFAERRGISRTSPDSDFIKCHKFLVKTDLIHGSLRKDATAIFEDCVTTLPGNDLLEKFDLHYLYFRNRNHFGGSDFRRFLGNMTWHPLASPSLFLASRLLDRNQREASRILYDMQEQLCPELNDIEFDKGPWPFPRTDAQRSNPLSLGPADTREWAQSNALRSKKIGNRRRENPTAHQVAPDKEAYYISEIMRCIGIIVDGGGSALFGTGFSNLWIEIYHGRTPKQLELLSKLYSISSVVEPDDL